MCNSGPCQYPEYADEWKWRCMTDIKADSENLVMTHWKHHVTERRWKQLMLISTKCLTEFEQRKEKVYVRFLKKEGMKTKKMECVEKKNPTGGVNLHKNVKEEAETNGQHPKKAVKCKLFDFQPQSDCKIKKAVPAFTKVKENIRKRKSLDIIEVSDDKENKENIPINLPIGNVQHEDFWTKNT